MWGQRRDEQKDERTSGGLLSRKGDYKERIERKVSEGVFKM